MKYFNLLTSAVLAGLFAIPSYASADDKTEFHNTMLRGIELYQQGKTDPAKYSEAIEQFTMARKYSDDPQPLYNIARSYQNQGNCPEALRYFREYEYAAFVNPSYGTSDVSEFIQELTNECGIITSRLVTFCMPSRTTVIVDKGEPTTCDQIHELRQGEHSIIFKLDGFATVSRAISVKPSEQINITVQMDKKLSKITSVEQHEMTAYDYHNFDENSISHDAATILSKAGLRINSTDVQMSPNALNNLLTPTRLVDRKMLWTGVAFSGLGVILAGVGGGISYAAFDKKIFGYTRNNGMFNGGVVMISAGAALGIIGSILMLVDVIQYNNEEDIRMGILSRTLAGARVITPSFNGAALSLTF